MHTEQAQLRYVYSEENDLEHRFFVSAIFINKSQRREARKPFTANGDLVYCTSAMLTDIRYNKSLLSVKGFRASCR